MADAPPTGFLVPKSSDGYGPPIPLIPGQRATVGRSPVNRVVLRDDLCSREHAELVPTDDGWAVRDLGSLNGTHVNNTKLAREQRLNPGDQVRFGGCVYQYVRDPADLPPPSPAATAVVPPAGVSIKNRIEETKYLSTVLAPPPGADPKTVAAGAVRRLPDDQAVGRLYRLAVDMAAATDPRALAEVALDGLLETIPAEVGAVLAVREERQVEPVAFRTRGSGPVKYHKVSQFVSNEVLATRQAVLAEDVTNAAQFKGSESLSELRATSLICAPVRGPDGTVFGLLHLYAIAATRRLSADDLEFALAVARQLGLVWHRLKRESALAVEVKQLKEHFRLDGDLVGRSPSLKRVQEQAHRAAATAATVLIRGESGVGKELVARAVHTASPRRDGPFVCLNCAALTETLLESELFGHEKGSFTGATERRIGKFEAADGGTIFLDEVGEMPTSTQTKFLRVLENQSFQRVGGGQEIKVDVRVVAATNRALEEAVKVGLFRRDLYYRLQVVQLDVPPLRARPEDVRPIAEHFFRRFVRETGRKLTGFTPAAVTKLERHTWPGNVRELRNVIERAVALGTGPVIDEADVWLPTLDTPQTGPAAVYQPLSMAEVERRHIEATLAHTSWNKSKAAEILGIERSTLDRKIKGYGLSR